MNKISEHFIESSLLDLTNLRGKKFDLDKIRSISVRGYSDSSGMGETGCDSGYVRGVGYLTIPREIIINEAKWIGSNKLKVYCYNGIIEEFIMVIEYSYTRILIEIRDKNDTPIPDKADFFAALFRDKYPSVEILGESRFVTIKIPKDFSFIMSRSERLRIDVADDFITFYLKYITIPNEVLLKKPTH